MANPRPGSMRDRAQHDGGRESREVRSSFGQRPAPERPAQRKQPYDPAVAPAGYDQDYWGMAVLFRDRAMKDVNLRVGPPVIYGEMRRVFEWFDLEHGSRAFQKRGDGTVEKTFGQMYRDGKGSRQTWVQVGYAVIEEFWSRRWDDDALTWFCDKDVIERMATVVCERWLSQRMKARRAATPLPEPEPLQWNREGHRKRRRTSAGE